MRYIVVVQEGQSSDDNSMYFTTAQPIYDGVQVPVFAQANDDASKSVHVGDANTLFVVFTPTNGHTFIQGKSMRVPLARVISIVEDAR